MSLLAGPSLEASLFSLFDHEPDAVALADARAALEALLRADAPRWPMRWLQLAGSVACADVSRSRADGIAPPQAPAVDGAVATPVEQDVAPGWRMRAFAAELMARVPDAVCTAVTVVPHLDLAAARAGGDAASGALVLHLQAAVDLGYRCATQPATALRPWGLVLLRRLLAGWGRCTDPDTDVPGALLMEQHAAQILSSLRAALGPGSPPNTCAAGAALAAEFVASGLSARDGGVHKRVLALLGGVSAGWRPLPLPERDSVEYSEWSAACLRAALLTAHARMAAASPQDATLAELHRPLAGALTAGWLALLRDFAAAVGLHEGSQDQYLPSASVLALSDVPIARLSIARAHLAYAWRPVLAAVAQLGVPAGGDASRKPAIPLGLDDHGLALSLACWALSREATAYAASASRIESSGPAGVWGAGPGFLPHDPPAASGIAALDALLRPAFLGTALFVSIREVAEVMATVAQAAASRSAQPLLKSAAPGLLLRVATSLKEDTTPGDERDAVTTLAAASLRIARVGLDQLCAGCAPEAAAAAAAGLNGLAILSQRLALPALPPTVLSLALSALRSPSAVLSDSVASAAAGALAAAARSCSASAAVDSAARTLQMAVADLAEDAEAVPRLRVLLSAACTLGPALQPQSAASQRCLDAITVLLDEAAGCPQAVQQEALAALQRIFASAAADAAAAPRRCWAEAVLASAGPAAAAAAHRGLSHPVAQDLVVEGIRALTAAVALASDLNAKVGVLLVLLPLLIAAAAADGPLQAVAVGAITRSAGAAPEAFKQAVGELSPETKAKLQAALRAGTAAAGPPVADVKPKGAAPGKPGGMVPPAFALRGFQGPPRK